ncbi:hypothetical protein Xcel_0509 [Xylanimonas cellulosilytica DSM 15894]|uniref:GCN5-related N-acetyltransferase n=1 Tax=Xylanimonas cellulosilytica (strain DSM 15894 / JCM 12276 / CECT 5975 / KCTC 9989 / LMG 20990 / NBRC 107835 / XIL07) TaxID=446471 RepID=D1BW45_XYLCX|nr:hypothetical protein [Xylanimonas cellulosilytica]ACZ29548.1 hypothetical protein Xcel_0509 [Xylanimonas cellulosilytica DSM 15894]
MVELVAVTRPLPDAPGFQFRNRWVDYALYTPGRYTTYSAMQSGQEVARLEIDWKSGLYEGMDPVDGPLLEIEFLDVQEEWRRRGIGTLTVHEVARTHPGHRLMARSEDADDFWGSFGWARHDHADGPRWYRPIYLAPEGWR